MTWTMPLQAHVDLTDGKEWLQEMRAAGVQPDEVTWNTLRKAHVVSDVAEARAVMKEMRATGIQPGDATRSTLPR